MSNIYDVDHLEADCPVKPWDNPYITTLTLMGGCIRIVNLSQKQAIQVPYRKRIFKVQVWPYRYNRRIRINKYKGYRLPVLEG